MRINEIELSNFRQHADKKVKLSGNLIGIIGPNGSGKSNLLKGIQYGLTGDVPGINKDRLTKWGAEDGYVRLLVNDNYEIIRHTASSNVLIQAPGIKAHTITKVNNIIKEVFGLDKELAQVLFVHQAEIDSVLFESPAKREQMFQKFCGMGSASTIHKQIGEVISDKFKTPPNYDEQIALSENKLEEDKARLNSLISSLGNDKPALSEEEIKQGKIELADKASLIQDLRIIIPLADSVSELKNTITALEQKLTSINMPDIDAEAVRAEIDGAKQLLIEVRKYNLAAAEYKRVENDLNALKAPTVDNAKLASLEAEYVQLKEQHIAAQTYAKMLSQILEAISKYDTKKCPICNSIINDPTEVNARLQKQIAESNKVTNPVDLNRTIQAAKIELANYAGNDNKLRALFDQAKTELAKLTPVNVSEDTLISAIAQLEQKRKDYCNISNEISKINTSLETNKALYNKQIADLDKRKEAINARLSDVKLTDNWGIYLQSLMDDSGKLASLIDIAVRQHTERSRQEGVVVELKRGISELEKAIKILEAKKAGTGNYTACMATLNSVRDWFHYSNGPRALSKSILTNMVVDINSFLGRFEAPFFVTANVDEGLSFNCIFNDGRDMPIDKTPDGNDLSGGEKILLATSFRLAGYCLFANKLGILSLDEPTVYLDEKNIGRFNSFLEKVKEVAAGLDLQIFMATHERSVIPYMDTVIDLT